MIDGFLFLSSKWVINMSKGKKTDPLTIYKVMLSYATTHNYSETARFLDLPISTVKKIVDTNKDKDEFVKLCNEKKDEFVERANNIIDKATQLLERRIDTALENQDEIEELIQEVYNAGNDEIKGAQKKALVKKLTRLQLNALNEITTAIGTMYDKRALAQGDPTSNVKIKLEDMI